jgi:hypothetical protein
MLHQSKTIWKTLTSGIWEHPSLIIIQSFSEGMKSKSDLEY